MLPSVPYTPKIPAKVKGVLLREGFDPWAAVVPSRAGLPVATGLSPEAWLSESSKFFDAGVFDPMDTEDARVLYELESVGGTMTDQLVEDYIAHRVAAAIVLGAATFDRKDVLMWAERESYVMAASERVQRAVRQIVADTRRYDEGTAGALEYELRRAAP